MIIKGVLKDGTVVGREIKSFRTKSGGIEFIHTVFDNGTGLTCNSDLTSFWAYEDFDSIEVINSGTKMCFYYSE